jgi:uroporphyrinogen decarboxylase
MTTGRETVRRTIRFERPGRLARDLPAPWGSDFAGVNMTPSPDARPSSGTDEWGAVWHNIGVCKLGEVKTFPLTDWADFPALNIPDVRDPRRWGELEGARERAGDRFLLAGGISLYERAHFIRGLHNVWTDIYLERENLGRLLDILVDMNLYAIERFAAAGADGYMWCDDWGLQNGLMIPVEAWRDLWKPRYARVYRAAHDAGMLTLLHSCGYIVDILDDLIEVGLDVIQMDQQENMGLELLGERFGGRITFYCPVDIQNTMARGNPAEIRAYCRKMVQHLGRPEGGFIAGWYGDPKGAGHTQEAIDAMCDEWMRISAEMEARATADANA